MNEQMRRAITEVRREGWKAAIITSVFEATLVMVVANLVISVLRPGAIPARVAIPPVISRLLSRVAGSPVPDPSITGGAVVAGALGLLVLVLGITLRVRRPLVERFEAVNPGLHESLRTARDSLADGQPSRIAPRLYQDVIDELRNASSIGLLDIRRLAVTALLIVVVSLASIQVAVVDLTLGDDPKPGDGDVPDGGVPSDYGGLQDPSGILGDREDVPTGEEDLDAIIDTSGAGGSDSPDTDSPVAYENSGFDDGSIEGQRAGFTESEQLEDAELIREYNLQIREVDDG